MACLARLQQLGDYEFNWSLGEQHRWQAADVAGRMARWRSTCKGLGVDDPSGDIYARLLQVRNP